MNGSTIARRLAVLTALLSLSGCASFFGATAVDGPTLCRRAAPYVQTHIQALLNDGGPSAQRSGLDLVTVLDAGCGW